MRPGQRRLLEQQAQRADQATDTLRCEPVRVVALSPLTVEWRGTNITVAHSDHLTALAVDNVVLLMIPPAGNPFVAFRLV